MLKNIPDIIIDVAFYSYEYISDKFRKKVHPIRGSVVYCDLLFDYAEHSGIYIGRNQIIHLNGKGVIEIVSPKEFLNKTTGNKIYVSCRNGFAVGSEHVAKRAESQLGNTRKYNVIFDNCHQFSSGCLIGDFENSSNFLWMLKDLSGEVLSSNEWRIWDR